MIGGVPRPRRADQPAAVVGRHPDRLRARPAGAARRPGAVRRPGRASAVRRGDGRGRRARAARTSTTGCTRTGSPTEFLSPLEPRAGAADVVARGWRRRRHAGGRRARSGRRRTSPRWTRTATRPASPARTAPAPASWPPGTGVHLNNMLGEEDLNPLGFHRLAPGTRVTSMMAPTIVLRDGEVELSLGSAGSNRLRSAILQVVRIRRRLRDGASAEAVRAGRSTTRPRRCTPSRASAPQSLDELDRRGYRVVRWKGLNLYFGGAQAVRRDRAGRCPAPATRAAAASPWSWTDAAASGRRPCRCPTRGRRPRARARDS